MKEEIPNKIVIKKLKAYFLTQEPEKIALLCSHLMIDINRMMTIDLLGEKEAENLMQRLHHQRNELIKFLKDGPSGDLKITIFNSDEE